MKIKEGILKEHLYNCAFKLSESQTFGQVKEVLKAMQFTPSGVMILDSHNTGYVLVFAHRLDGKPTYEWFPVLVNTRRMRTLSEIFEDESPKYVKCIDSAHGIAVRKGVIYRVIGEINKYYSVDLGEIGTGEFLKFRFTPATEKEYIDQQSNIEQEEALKPAPTKDPLEETVEELKKAGLYLISEEQISVLADINGTVKAQLKEFIPNAECLQPEKTYKLGDKFIWKEDKEVWQINRHSEVAKLIGLNNEKGELLARTVSVIDVFNITKDELKQIREDLFERAEEVK